jgi:hypothetical protein
MFCLHKSIQLLVRRKEDYIIICKLFAEQKEKPVQKIKEGVQVRGTAILKLSRLQFLAGAFSNCWESPQLVQSQVYSSNTVILMITPSPFLTPPPSHASSVP